MALKDLTTSSSRLTEQQIEEIVSPYVRFDPEAGAVVLLPAAGRLSGKQRVLVYLTALQGWPFVTEKTVATAAAPAHISDALHIAGGTLRPLLKQLKDGHFLSMSDGDYSVRGAALESIKAELAASAASEARAPRNNQEKRPGGDTVPHGGGAGAGARRKGKRHGGESNAFIKWVADGFFRQPRTFREVLDQFHRKGRMIKSTSLPGYLLEGVRAGVLARVKKEIKGKRVWVYQAASSSRRET